MRTALRTEQPCDDWIAFGIHERDWKPSTLSDNRSVAVTVVETFTGSCEFRSASRGLFEVGVEHRRGFVLGPWEDGPVRIRSRRLPHIKAGRSTLFVRVDLDAWVTEQRVRPRP